MPLYHGANTGKFTAANCPNQSAVGVLTDAGVQAQFFSSMAFRRARWVQETFMCRKFPAETAGTPQPRPGGSYTSPWDYGSITGKLNNKNAKIDFQDDKSIICANCHGTMNHQASLFANFDAAGVPKATPQVQVPIPGSPLATLADWLPAGETTAWRNGKPTKDITEFAAAVAADPVFASCMVNRIWNWGMSRPDVIDDGATITADLASKLTTELMGNNWNLKKSVRSVFTSDSFVNF